MARKATAWNRVFGATAKACFAQSETMKKYGQCMRTRLKAASGGMKKATRARRKRR